MMEMNRTSSSLIFLILLFLSTSTLFTSDVSAAIVGGWKPIKNPTNDRETQTVAKFAVAEHNKAAASSGGKKEQLLVFLKVVSGETQVVAGTNYRLIIMAKDGSGIGGGGAVRSYEAVVFVKPWEKVMKVTSFKLVG